MEKLRMRCCWSMAAVLAAVMAAGYFGLSGPASAAKKKKSKAPTEAKAPAAKESPETPYAGDWTLASLDGKKMPPYWNAKVKGEKFVITTESPEMNCATSTKMALQGRDVTFTTTSTNCKGDKVGDVDEGQLTLYSNTLTFISKTNGKKWVFVRKTDKKPISAAGAAPEEAEPVPDVRAPVAQAPAEAKALPRVVMLKPDVSMGVGEVEFAWEVIPDALRYQFVLEGGAGEGFINDILEINNSNCPDGVCHQARNMVTGLYTTHVDAVFKVPSGKVNFTVGAKGKPKKEEPQPIPADIISPVGRLADASVSQFKWYSTSGGLKYEVHVHKAGAAPETATVRGGTAEEICKDEVCSISISALGPGDYVWWLETETLSRGKLKSFSVRGMAAERPKLEQAPPPDAAPAKKKKRSWKDGPGGGF